MTQRQACAHLSSAEQTIVFSGSFALTVLVLMLVGVHRKLLQFGAWGVHVWYGRPLNMPLTVLSMAFWFESC
jgi:hypothetical protein